MAYIERRGWILYKGKILSDTGSSQTLIDLTPRLGQFKDDNKAYIINYPEFPNVVIGSNKIERKDNLLLLHTKVGYSLVKEKIPLNELRQKNNLEDAIALMEDPNRGTEYTYIYHTAANNTPGFFSSLEENSTVPVRLCLPYSETQQAIVLGSSSYIEINVIEATSAPRVLYLQECQGIISNLSLLKNYRVFHKVDPHTMSTTVTLISGSDEMRETVVFTCLNRKMEFINKIEAILLHTKNLEDAEKLLEIDVKVYEDVSKSLSKKKISRITFFPETKTIESHLLDAIGTVEQEAEFKAERQVTLTKPQIMSYKSNKKKKNEQLAPVTIFHKKGMNITTVLGYIVVTPEYK